MAAFRAYIEQGEHQSPVMKCELETEQCRSVGHPSVPNDQKSDTSSTSSDLPSLSKLLRESYEGKERF